MRLRFMPEAENALYELEIWIEESNTPGSGTRFINKFIDHISSYAVPNAVYAGCTNEVLALYHLSCITINDWVIAFRKSKNEFVVHYILYGSGLK